MTEAENMEVARQIAAQAWCDPETSGIEMDVRLAEAFAKRIAALRARCEAAEAEVEDLRGRSYFNAMIAAERSRDEARAEVAFYKGREEHYRKVLNVTDGGQYRADWDGAIDRLRRERDEAREALREVEWEGEHMGRGCCPMCGGLMPYEPPHRHSFLIKDDIIGHKPGCALARVLSGEKEGA